MTSEGDQQQRQATDCSPNLQSGRSTPRASKLQAVKQISQLLNDEPPSVHQQTSSGPSPARRKRGHGSPTQHQNPAEQQSISLDTSSWIRGKLPSELIRDLYQGYGLDDAVKGKLRMQLSSDVQEDLNKIFPDGSWSNPKTIEESRLQQVLLCTRALQGKVVTLALPGLQAATAAPMGMLYNGGIRCSCSQCSEKQDAWSFEAFVQHAQACVAAALGSAPAYVAAGEPATSQLILEGVELPLKEVLELVLQGPDPSSWFCLYCGRRYRMDSTGCATDDPLLLCDGCPAAFHDACHEECYGAPIPQQGEDEPWFCLSCQQQRRRRVLHPAASLQVGSPAKRRRADDGEQGVGVPGPSRGAAAQQATAPASASAPLAAGPAGARQKHPVLGPSGCCRPVAAPKGKVMARRTSTSTANAVPRGPIPAAAAAALQRAMGHAAGAPPDALGSASSVGGSMTTRQQPPPRYIPPSNVQHAQQQTPPSPPRAQPPPTVAGAPLATERDGQTAAHGHPTAARVKPEPGKEVLQRPDMEGMQPLRGPSAASQVQQQRAPDRQQQHPQWQQQPPLQQPSQAPAQAGAPPPLPAHPQQYHHLPAWPQARVPGMPAQQLRQQQTSLYLQHFPVPGGPQATYPPPLQHQQHPQHQRRHQQPQRQEGVLQQQRQQQPSAQQACQQQQRQPPAATREQLQQPPERTTTTTLDARSGCLAAGLKALDAFAAATANMAATAIASNPRAPCPAPSAAPAPCDTDGADTTAACADNGHSSPDGVSAAPADEAPPCPRPCSLALTNAPLQASQRSEGPEGPQRPASASGTACLREVPHPTPAAANELALAQPPSPKQLGGGAAAAVPEPPAPTTSAAEVTALAPLHSSMGGTLSTVSPCAGAAAAPGLAPAPPSLLQLQRPWSRVMAYGLVGAAPALADLMALLGELLHDFPQAPEAREAFELVAAQLAGALSVGGALDEVKTEQSGGGGGGGPDDAGGAGQAGGGPGCSLQTAGPRAFGAADVKAVQVATRVTCSMLQQTLQLLRARNDGTEH